MNEVTLALALVSCVSCARLDNLQYLPPQGNANQGPGQQQPFPVKSGSQGGQFPTPSQQYGPQPQGPSGSQGPVGSQGHTGSQQYPQGNAAQPSNQYGNNAGSHQYPQGDAAQPSKQYGTSAGSQQYPQGNAAQPSNQYGTGAGQPGGAGSQQYPGQQYPEQRSPLADVPILRLDNENPGDGTYRYAYETGNGIAAQEEGSAQSGWNKAQGSYHFTSPEGQTFDITYTADENGYIPQGAHLPTSPPIPEAILKSLEVIRQAEAQGGYREGQYEPEGDEGQYHENHDEGQYNQQQPSGGYKQGAGDLPQNGPQGQGVPQGFSHQGQQRYPGQQGGQQQPVAANGGYKY